MVEKIMIPGPCGQIEAEFSGTNGDRVMVLCHPHPLYGGSMYDHVLSVVEGKLLESGVSALRFNFRGVGHSDGAHDQGVGEVDDVVAACEWAAQQAGSVMLGGYSFGAAAAARAVSRFPVAAMLLVAPPPALLGDCAPPTVPSVAIAGDQDDFVDLAALRQWIGETPSIELLIEAGADHFFAGYGAGLAGAAELACGLSDSA